MIDGIDSVLVREPGHSVLKKPPKSQKQTSQIPTDAKKDKT